MKFTKLVAAATVFVLIATPAFAATDGKAKVTAAAAEAVRGMAGKSRLSTADVRALIAASITATGLGADERDLFEEIASGAGVQVDAAGRTVRLPAPEAAAAPIASLLVQMPNLNTLWGEDPAKMAQLVEISRWGARMEQRILGYMVNQLKGPVAASTFINAYAPLNGYLAQAWNVFMAMPDAETREQGRLLLLAASNAALDQRTHEKAADLRFLIAWMDQDTSKATARQGKPLIPRPAQE